MFKRIREISKTLNIVITLNNFNYKVTKGQIVTLRVPSVKSAIIKLFMGDYPTNLINISINGKQISNYTLDELRKLILYLPKETDIFHGTIMEIIKNGRIDLSEREIVEASRAANALKFILDLPRGYNTIIGEGGARLSEGQGQKIAIVRAILAKAPILLLDNITSALDIKSEKQFQEGLKTLVKDKFIIVVDSSIDKLDIYEIRSN
jgi:ABC-type multidrug transport system fused ATPase/permease subunit